MGTMSDRADRLVARIFDAHKNLEQSGSQTEKKTKPLWARLAARRRGMLERRRGL